MTIIALVVRATLNATGAITFTGNTLGLSRSNTEGVPGTQDSIGAFTTTNTALKYGTYPSGTTSLYTLNNSSAILNLPAGSTILYAELIWGGSYVNGTVNLTAFINNAVTFTTPAGTSSITPDNATKNEFDLGGGALGYVRSANVTTLIQQGMAGTYTTGNVVGTIVIPGDSTANHAGWTLAVIYQNTSLPFRNMSLRVGAVLVQSTSPPVNTTITGFATPVTGALGGRALFSAQEGDANRTGDQALFGPTTGSLVALSGPNNFAANFFASQINNDLGNLNTTGTFGSSNQINGAPGTNISAGRQGWDITNIDVSARLINNQSSAVLQLTTSGDAYVVNGNGIQVDINAPKITVTKSANVTGTVLGDTITYSVTTNNTGTASAASIVLSDALPVGSTFVPGSVTVAGVAKPTYDITAGAPLGSLAFGTSITVTYKATITSVPTPQQIANMANAAFTFQSVAGGSVISGVIPSNTVTTPVYAPRIGIVKSANTANGSVGSTVTYTLQVANTGNIGANVTITDNIPQGTSYVANSFKVNGVTVPGANPVTGVNIGTVAAGGTSTVTFDILILVLPSPSQIINKANSTYTFQPPDGRTISGAAESNTLTIPVRLPSVGAVKSTPVIDAVIGDTFTYNTVITNSGVESVTNVVLTDTLPTGVVFVPNSVLVGGIGKPSAVPDGGIGVGSIAAGNSVTVSFQVNVVSLPPSGQLLNMAGVSYSSGTFNGTSLSNTITTPVFQPQVSIAKSVNSTNATVGDTLTYTLTVNNQGNIAVQPTIFDAISASTSFVAGSVTINGSSSPGSNPATGIVAGSLAPSGTTVITFQVVLQSLPSPPRLTNLATTNYTYQPPDGRILSGSATSNTIDIPASAPNIMVSKSVNLTYAAIGDTLIYSLDILNNSVVQVTNIVINDALPSGVTFLPGSVTVDGVPKPTADPTSGYTLGSLNPGVNSHVVFRGTVTSVPNPPQADNHASISFTSGAFTGATFSNTVTTYIEQPIISLTKSASQSLAVIGDIIAYTIEVRNTGSTAADITIFDNIPAGSSFLVNSVSINNAPFPGVDPVSGIPIGTLSAGGTKNVSFLVTVESLPNPQQLVDQGTASYTFMLTDGRSLSGTGSSNTVSIPVSAPNVVVMETVNVSTAIQGDTVIYTVVVTNQGVANVNNVILTSIADVSISFIPGSVVVNGVSSPNTNPSTGIPIGTLAPNTPVTVTFEVKITMPTPQINNQSNVSFTSGTFSGSSSSNNVITPVTQANMTLVKSANTTNATVGDTVVYTIAVTNTGNLPGDVIVTDTIPTGTSYVLNSAIVDGTPQPGADPVAGINAGSIAAGATKTVSFSVLINTLPSPQVISNTGTATYTFFPPDGRTITRTATSNTVSFPVSSPNVAVVKSTTSTALTVGDTITYKSIITNNGITAINNASFSDQIPTGGTFVPGSVVIIGAPTPVVPPNPASGVTLGTIAVGASVTVFFDVVVTSLPSPAQFNNFSAVSFTSGAISSTTTSNTITTPIYQPIINVLKSANSINATVGDTIVYTLNVSNSGNYATDVFLSDTIPSNTTFLANSVFVGTQPWPGADPATGFSIGSISPGTTVPVTFSVIIDSLPNPQILTNTGTAAYSFTLPDGRTFNRSTNSNTVTISVSSPDVRIDKSTTATDAVVNDIIPYSFVITNNGLAPINNVVFSDPLPSGEAFVPGSVVITGAPTPPVPPNPVSGIGLGTIAVGATVTITFNVQVTSLPNPAQLNNYGSVSFTSGAFSAVTFSNTITTPVYQPILAAAKSSNTTNATIGDMVIYTITVSNTGNYPASISLVDTIPNGTMFQTNSVVLNGITQPGADPATGIPFTSQPGATDTVTFGVVIVSLPNPQVLTNTATANYTFVPPDGRILNGAINSNTVNIPVSAPNVTIDKSTTATDAVVGDAITYSSIIANKGISTVNNVQFFDQLPAFTAFIPGSVTINGVVAPNANPTNGISLGSILPSNMITVNFNVTVTALPPTQQLSNQSSASFTTGAFAASAFSNTVIVPVYQPIISVVKSANTTNATVGDTIIYSLTLHNSGNLPAVATVYDSIPSGTAFVPNSVIINGVTQPGVDPSTGINAGTIAPGASVDVKITLEVTVDALPSPQLLSNQATANYTYSPPDGRPLNGSVSSNILIIPVSAPNVTVTKSTDAIDAIVGDTISYKIIVKNSGIEAVNNVILTDPIPTGTVFITGSVTVDGVSKPTLNPSTGVPIGTIPAGVSVTVTFEVTVV
ncbi:DUF11 domain-containing protein [Paenibacillus qinlingensis]|uniref:DUF11 domain-containing protein n=1 Tax=Paenibacillus qinlingensis TaxID=1837343 RepID=UPI0015667B1F|nr:DUF11 domain-containing protein [Paenibacillus qinlingensis]NQX62049.1 DUF11 domain-containing protein [Paenibacillus qinlingensis]